MDLVAGSVKWFATPTVDPPFRVSFDADDNAFLSYSQGEPLQYRNGSNGAIIAQRTGTNPEVIDAHPTVVGRLLGSWGESVAMFDVSGSSIGTEWSRTDSGAIYDRGVSWSPNGTPYVGNLGGNFSSMVFRLDPADGSVEWGSSLTNWVVGDEARECQHIVADDDFVYVAYTQLIDDGTSFSRVNRVAKINASDGTTAAQSPDLGFETGALLVGQFIDLSGDGSYLIVAAIRGSDKIVRVNTSDMSVVWKRAGNRPYRAVAVGPEGLIALAGTGSGNVAEIWNSDATSMLWSWDPRGEVSGTSGPRSVAWRSLVEVAWGMVEGGENWDPPPTIT